MEKGNFGEIRRVVKYNNAINKENKDLGDLTWRHYNTPLVNFGSSFSNVLPEEYITPAENKIISGIEFYGEAFKRYVEDTLSKSKNPDRYAIEFGGPGSRLFRGFTKGFFIKTVGVCLDDARHEDWETDDIVNNHAVMEGDILHPKQNDLYHKINKFFKKKKADLIVSRMMKPAEEIEKHPVILDKVIREWYGLLNDNGLLFAQFDYFLEHNPSMYRRLEGEIFPEPGRQSERDVEAWAKKIRERFPNELDIQVDRGIIRIHKKAGAPAELPSMKELFK